MFFKRPKFIVHTRPETGRETAYQKFKGRLTKVLPEISGFLLIVLLAWAALQSARLSAMVFQVKDQILNSSRYGLKNLEQAKTLLIKQDLGHATLELDHALQNFNRSLAELAQLEQNLLGLTVFFPQSRSAQNFIAASIDLTEAGRSALNFYELFSAFSFGQSGLLSGSTDFSDLITEINTLQSKLALAHKKIKNVNLQLLPENQRNKVKESLQKLELAQNSVHSVKELLTAGQTVFSGQKRILLLFQNQNELRPTGGFIGSFAELQLTDGKIIKLRISSIYDLDGQLKEKIIPPWPLLAVNPRWYLRDANWFSSFDESAQKIMEFYEKEGGETPDLLMAITPEIIAELLEITGPLTTQSGQSLNSENLVETLQVLTQGNPAEPTNEPKKILNELFTALFQKIGQLSSAQKTVILKTLQTGFTEKQCLLYAKNPAVQKVFESFNWAGKISQANDRDYLLISRANLGGTKTDLEISQAYKLESTVGPDGQVQNLLTLSVTNQMPNLPHAHNISFFRIYVPENSELVEAQGFDAATFQTLSQPSAGKTDPEVIKWEKAQTREIATGTVIGKESYKTFFGNWLTLKPQETRVIKIKYTLPFRLKNIDRISLLMQKQPGSKKNKFEYSINFPNFRLEWENFGEATLNAKSLNVSGLLNKDRFFGIVLRKD